MFDEVFVTKRLLLIHGLTHGLGAMVDFSQRLVGDVEIDNRRLSVGNRLQEALEENIDLILLIGDEVDVGLYSVIYKGHRYSHKMEDILQLIVEA